MEFESCNKTLGAEFEHLLMKLKLRIIEVRWADKKLIIISWVIVVPVIIKTKDVWFNVSSKCSTLCSSVAFLDNYEFSFINRREPLKV